ncbi:hypothetical protein [Micromonospora sp. CB01531]|uniref:hypothetical protein n=1 Tax=Micromonospora sp. CB01531 TaxID=1718947 RepID=UPI00093EEFD6|nr:hypothetical protein [Micromonospora sp. CB01531]
MAGSVFWPVALYVAVEILTRTAWPPGHRWTTLRFGGLLPVAAAAALVSHRHLSGLLDHYGEDAVTVTVAVGPLAVDGLMLMATGALLTTGRPTATVTTPATDGRTDGHAPEATRPQATATADTTTRAGDWRTTTATATAARRHHVRPASPRPRQADLADDIAAKVAAIVADRPDVTAEDVAAEIGRAPRTARRYLAAVRANLAGA